MRHVLINTGGDPTEAASLFPQNSSMSTNLVGLLNEKPANAAPGVMNQDEDNYQMLMSTTLITINSESMSSD